MVFYFWIRPGGDVRNKNVRNMEKKEPIANAKNAHWRKTKRENHRRRWAEREKVKAKVSWRSVGVLIFAFDNLINEYH